ncbi:MAG: copper-translocating P-type ATPase [Bacteroidetes bacterium]|nr:copper-translocating P-type ATPase [Bacteroidota bacterium]
MAEDFRRRFWVSLLLTVPIVVLSPMLQMWAGLGERLRFPGDAYLLLAFSTLLFGYGGYPFLKGLVDELRDRKPGMMTLVAVAITVAYVYSSAVVFGLKGEGFFWELATLADLMLLGHWIEMRSVMGASRALEALARLMPQDAHRVGADGSVHDVPLDRLAAGDRVLVKPGEKLPADGVVVDGTTSVNEAMLTGESRPVSKAAGATVIGGSINGEGAITVEVQKTGSESFLAQVIDLVRQAQQSQSRTQDVANRAALWLTVIAIGGGIVTFLAWWLQRDVPLAFAIERAVTVMVISCPHALGLAVPLVVAVSTGIAAGSGLLIRDRAAFERARSLDAIIFDKTGTLTEGTFGVTDVELFGEGLSREELLRLAAAVEGSSQHPIATGIVAAAGAAGAVRDFVSITGKGVQGVVEGRQVVVASPRYVSELKIDVPGTRAAELREQGKTVVFVLVDGTLRGAIALADTIRAESREAVAALKGMGIGTMMLTGDNRHVAAWVAGEVGVDEFFAEVLPGDKAAAVENVQARGLLVAMTGDGVNDAPALARADVGIAIGAGTDVAIETADVILVRSNPLDVVAIVELARSTYRKMVQNLWWAAGYNAVAIPLAAGVLSSAGIVLSPAIGAVLMSLSTIIVAVNARTLRLRHDAAHR